MSYADELREHARLAMLRFIEDAPRYTSNVSMLADLLPKVGIAYTRAQVTTEARWLEEQGLVEIEDESGFLILTGTVRGIEAAQGIARIDGVQRPRPGV